MIGAPGGPYGRKPRPVVMVQEEIWHDLTSIVVCPLTRTDSHAAILRPSIEPSASNGLEERSFVMIDKVAAMPRSQIVKVAGSIDFDTMERIDTGLAILLGLARR